MSPAAAARDVGRRLPMQGEAVEVVGLRGCLRARGWEKVWGLKGTICMYVVYIMRLYVNTICT